MKRRLQTIPTTFKLTFSHSHKHPHRTCEFPQRRFTPLTNRSQLHDTKIAMSEPTLNHLNHINRETLSSVLLASPSEDTVVVVDVRDHDHVGGHIKASRHVPSSTLDERVPDLVRELQNAPRVVFHCALSQQRGPKAALKYLREREKLFPGSTINVAAKSKNDTPNTEIESAGTKKQEVLVLDGGFVEWQEKYGNDARLTENYNASIWEDGY